MSSSAMQKIAPTINKAFVIIALHILELSPVRRIRYYLLMTRNDESIAIDTFLRKNSSFSCSAKQNRINGIFPRVDRDIKSTVGNSREFN